MYLDKEIFYFDFLRTFRYAKDLKLVKRKRKTPLDYGSVHEYHKCTARLVKDVLTEFLKDSPFFNPPKSYYSRVYIYPKESTMPNWLNANMQYTEEEMEVISRIRALRETALRTTGNGVSLNGGRISVSVEYTSVYVATGYIYTIDSYSVLLNAITLLQNYKQYFELLSVGAKIYNDALERSRVISAPPEIVRIPISAEQVGQASVEGITFINQAPIIMEHDASRVRTCSVPEQEQTPSQQNSFNLALERWRQRQAER